MHRKKAICLIQGAPLPHRPAAVKNPSKPARLGEDARLVVKLLASELLGMSVCSIAALPDSSALQHPVRCAGGIAPAIAWRPSDDARRTWPPRRRSCRHQTHAPDAAARTIPLWRSNPLRVPRQNQGDRRLRDGGWAKIRQHSGPEFASKTRADQDDKKAGRPAFLNFMG
jgi:hypothetical protein